MNSRFRQLREEKELTQDGLRDRFNQQFNRNYTTAAISYFENNKRLPEISALADFADFFNVSIDYLIGKSDIRNIPAKENNAIDFIENLFPDNPEIVQCLHNITEDGIISDGDSKYKLDDSARTMLRTMILAYLKEAKEKGTEHAKINLP